ncbi:thrombospondin type 3 repeat-containing protein [Flavobacteriaceae bacterium M23B6Z8]
MKRIFLLFAFAFSAIAYAQFNEGAPWMKELENTSSRGPQQPYSIYEISEAFDKYWENRDYTKKGSGHKPYKRWESYWIHLADENGYLPTAKEQWETYRRKLKGIGRANPTSDWQPLGPFTHLAPGQRLPGQGRVNAIAVDPNDPDTWYVGAPAGGIWKSVNAGLNWVPLSDNLPQIGVSGIAIDPNNSNVIYISTGDDDAGDTVSAGVFKSIDGGLTWNETGINPSNTPSSMNEILMDPANSSILWVATNDGVYKTTNGGNDWTLSLAGQNVKDIKLRPGSSTTVYAVTNDRFYRSTDAGITFNRIAIGLPTSSGRFAMAVTPANANYIYIVSANTRSDDYSFRGIFKSVNGGDSFSQTAVTTDILESSQAWFDLAIEASPTNPEQIFVGCLNIWKSDNGGNTFFKLNNWFIKNDAYTHADIHFLRFFNGDLYCGSDGGIYSSSDNGFTFTDHTSGLAISQFYRISVGRNDASKIIGGLQDNGGHSRKDGQWRNYHGGDGMDNVMDQSDNALIYGFTQYGGSLNISDDGGESLVAIVQEPNSLRGNWITPLAMDKNGTVYSAYNALFRLDGLNWTKVSDNFFANVDDLEIDPIDPSIIYVAINRALLKSTDSGVTFNNVYTFPSNVTEIEVNNNDNSIIYATTASNGIYGVFKSENGGEDFASIRGNLPTDQPFLAIIHQARNTTNPIYVGTNIGVYRLDDTLTEWEEYYTNLPNVPIRDMDISLAEGKLIIGTYGRGVWESPIPVEIPDSDIGLVAINQPTGSQIFCGGAVPEIEVENNGTTDITEVIVTYSINDGTDSVYNWSGIIAVDEKASIQLPPLNFENGESLLKVNVTIADDAYGDNNDLAVTFFGNVEGNAAEVNSFETESDALVTYNENGGTPEWQRGAPAGTLLNAAASGSNVYGTNLNGDHSNNVKSYLVTRCYDFSTITNPVFKFKMAFELEINFDIMYVEYSTDQGGTWNVLGTKNSGPNWYNSDRTNASSGVSDDCQNCPGAQWTGTNATMTEYSYDFTSNIANGDTDLRSETNIMFRFVFHSDPAVVEEGVIIDDFVIEGEQDDDDDDNDGVLDEDDNCPSIANADQKDTDGDGEGDVCDDDDDGDGILDVNDNCPLTPNANQADADNDGIGDVCDTDSDNDGVLDVNDVCPNTPAGTTVDVTGCEVFSLPSNNFAIKISGETCISSDNGRIDLTAQASFSYTASVTGPGGFDESYPFTSTLGIPDLAAGDYTICITMTEEPGYEQCFNATVSEPEDLSVFSRVNSIKKQVTLSLEGGERYFITLNGTTVTTTESEITMELPFTENTLQVKTDKDCQGVYQETILLNDQILVYPNPLTGNRLFVNLGPFNQEKVFISVISLQGQKVLAKEYPVSNGQIQINVGGLAQGAYLLNIKTDGSLLNYKIIKR